MMNLFFALRKDRKLIARLMIALGCLAVVFVMLSKDLLLPSRLLFLKVIDPITSISFTRVFYIVVCAIICFVLVLGVLWEVRKIEFREKVIIASHDELESEIDFLKNQLSSKMIHSNFFHKIEEFSTSCWDNGEFETYFHCNNSMKEILYYLIRIKNKDVIVSWKEERDFIYRLIGLVELIQSIKDTKIELFDDSVNYRFPIGLFVLPLFEALEHTINFNHSTLRIECFSAIGVWSCKIVNALHYSEHLKPVFEELIVLEEKVINGNWPIKLERVELDQVLEVSIRGRYAC